LPSFVKTDDSYNVFTTLRNLTKLKSLLSVICVNCTVERCDKLFIR
jgi:hypothetical protein